MLPRRKARFELVWRLIVLLASLDFTANTSALSAGSNYVMHVWQAESGLPQNSVTTVLQTRDGYIWIGTYSALARFDGVRFTIFDTANSPGLHSSRVTSLFEDNRGTLWIGDEYGALTRLEAGRFIPVEFDVPWKDRSIFRMGADDDGDLWLVNREGMLTRLKDSMTYRTGTGETMSRISMSSEPGGILVAEEPTILTLRHGVLEPLALKESTDSAYFQGICPARNGGLWIGNNGMLREWTGHQWSRDLGRAPWDMRRLTTMFETRSGFVVGGTSDSGLYLVSNAGEVVHFARTNGMPSDWITSGIEDHEGNLWVGTRGGLVMLHMTSVATVNPPDKWQGFPVLSVAEGSNGEIWAGTEGAGVYRFHSGQWTHYGAEEGLAHPFIWSVSRDARGRIWTGTWGNGIFLQNDTGFVRVPGTEADLSALAVMHDGEVTWIGTSVGLVRYAAGKAEWVVREPLMAKPDVRCIAKDRDGTIWFGTFGGGLGRWKNSGLRQFRKADGLPSDYVQCLRSDPDGELWIGTFGGGLARMKENQFTVIDRKQGLPSNDIGDIEEDERGHFWISTHGGILRISRQDLHRCADGASGELKFQSFDVSDGLPTVECAGGLQPAGCRSRDGRLWFPTSKGLVTINPDNVRTNELPPPVLIERLLVDDHDAAKSDSADPALRIPPGRHRVELQYTALSYIAPERVQFRYRLEGLDKDWIPAGPKRVADYSYLPPGKYAFEVIACNNDGIWNPVPARIPFAVLPYFWQTLWFRVATAAAMLAGACGLAWIDARRRMRRKLERIEQQHAVEQERSRIAHDIHDDLGSHLTRITLLSDPARNGTRSENAVPNAGMTQINASARELTRALAEIVWAVNPRHDTLESLADYLQQFAQEFLGHAGIRCRLDLPLELPTWPLSAEVRHNLFLAFKEALNNIVKHAAATEVVIFLALEPKGFRVVIQDNGSGFPGISEQEDTVVDWNCYGNGNGLRSIHSRVAQIGGRCEIRSFHNRGSRLELIVPLAARDGASQLPADRQEDSIHN